MRRDDGRFDWDVPLGRRWVVLLVAAWLLPLVVPLFESIVWIWPWSAWSDSSTMEIVQSLVPVLLGVVVWALLGLPRRRLRGGLVLLACAGSLLIPYGQMMRGLGDETLAWELFRRIGWQGLALTLGLAAIVAGNRQQKRSLGRGIAPWITCGGGLALLAVFFVPFGLTDPRGRPLVVASVFLEGEAWSQLWPALLWAGGLLGMGAAAALSPLAARIGDPLQTLVENAISGLARLVPLLLPVVIVGLYVAHGGPGLGYVLLVLVKVLLHGYAVVLLMAVGLARLLDGASPRSVERLLESAHEEPDVGDAEPAASPA